MSSQTGRLGIFDQCLNKQRNLKPSTTSSTVMSKVAFVMVVLPIFSVTVEVILIFRALLIQIFMYSFIYKLRCIHSLFPKILLSNFCVLSAAMGGHSSEQDRGYLPHPINIPALISILFGNWASFSFSRDHATSVPIAYVFVNKSLITFHFSLDLLSLVFCF